MKKSYQNNKSLIWKQKSSYNNEIFKARKQQADKAKWSLNESVQIKSSFLYFWIKNKKFVNKVLSKISYNIMWHDIK